MRIYSPLIFLLTLAGVSSAVNAAITVSPPFLPSTTFNQAGYSQTVTASGGTGTLTLSHSGTLPPGMAFTDATGVLDGTPTAFGTYTFTITATDTTLSTGSMTYTLPVIQAAPGTFVPVASLATGRDYPTATLLPNGKL